MKPIRMRGVVGREEVTVEEEKLMLQSENWYENHKYASLRMTKKEKRVKIFYEVIEA